MEAPLPMREREEDEDVAAAMGLKTRTRSHSHSHSHSVTLNASSSTSSSITSESSESSDIILDGFLGTQNVEETFVGSVVNEVGFKVEAQKEEDFEEPSEDEEEIIVDSNEVSFSINHEGTNGVYVHHNGNTAVYSLPESKVDQDISTNSSSSSKSPDTVIGLKDLDGLLDESSNDLNFASTDVYNALKDTLNNVPESVENDIVLLSLPKDPIPDVESVMQKHLFTSNSAQNVLVDTLNNAPKSVENDNVLLSHPEDPIPEVQVIDVESFMQKHLFTSNNENVDLSLPKDSIPEIEEFDVERVIQKQETHDFYCPNCNSCITKRVILKRRKRKIQDISSSEDALNSTPSQSPAPPTSDEIVEITQQNAPSSNDGAAEEHIYGITCLSCFRIFLPTKNGWLWRIFGKNPEVPVQKGDLLTEPLLSTHGVVDEGDTSVDANVDEGKGNVFPLWIVNCCQPSEKRPAHPYMPVAQEPDSEPIPSDDISDNADRELPNDDIKPLLTPPNGAEGLEHKTNSHLPIINGTHPYKPIAPVPSDSRPPEVPNGKPFQLETTPDSDAEGLEHKTKPHLPIINGTHTFRPIAPLSSESQPPEVPNGKPLPPETISDSDASLPSLTTEAKPPTEIDQIDIPLSHEPEPPVTTPADKPLSPEIKPDSGNGYALWFTNCCQPRLDGPRLPSKPDLDYAVEHTFESIPGRDMLKQPKPITPIAPGDDDNPFSTEPISPTKPTDIKLVPEPKLPEPLDTGGKLTISMPDQEAPRSSPPTMLPPDDIPPETRPPDLEAPLLDASQGSSRSQEGAGVEIVKAIVYGGLLESITSLSVITSAVGGDATTLNIVALGLANVFGGLVLLFHNLRVLKHEHGTERYIQHLGRPGHFFLHATVAVLSYLVFGLMAPIIYGFAFRKSDNKDYKIITLAAACLVSITVLSTAKSYVRSPPKAYIQTIFYYVCIAFSVSGLGYVTGNLINMLLKKLGVFDPRSAVPEAGDMKGVWASY